MINVNPKHGMHVKESTSEVSGGCSKVGVQS